MQRSNTITTRFLREAGINEGMKILEIGCGNGEVTSVLASLVGPSGTVLAVDRSEAPLVAARNRLDAAGLTAVSFLQRDVNELTESSDLSGLAEYEFDALVGRRVLMYLPDPAAVLRRLKPLLRPQGLVVFEESDTTMVPGSKESLPLHDRCMEWLRETLRNEGANIHMGFDLPSVYLAAGYSVEGVSAEAIVQGQGTQFLLADLVRMMVPRIVKAEVATEAEIDIDNLTERMVQELRPGVVYISDMTFCVKGRSKPVSGTIRESPL
ncbi:methyltransferase domain-containing protein [Leptonema illini]|uniref:Methyltransferase type 12 n=1 Tax=Leptonema illini DSM 21528 TaxID=929563 RepID=H2CGP8_9LEPT|nr:methyltransferase domain-containing protein [Leptonema illini]EHQ04724.1 Methyltransferase type 12 [Leptonema illini DSM 21528]